MGEELTHEQVEQRYITLMGQGLGAIYARLWNECVWLFWRWDDYIVLFGTSEERLNKLNEAASAFFYQLQGTLFESVLLHMCRMTDPVKSRGRDNLTLELLPDLVDAAIRNELKNLLASARQKCEFARGWRNLRISHSDLGLALDKSAKPLPAASRKSVREGLDAIAAVLNRVGRHHGDEHVRYDLFESRLSARALVCVIEEGLKAEQEWRAAVKAQRGSGQ